MNTNLQLKDLKNLIKLAISDDNITKFILDALNRGINIEELGTLFEKSLEQLERKSRGQFYTPKEVVDYIVDYLNIDSTKKIIDPACGCGSFLLSIMEKIKENEKTPDYSNIFGIDINKNALDITKLSMLIKSDFTQENIKLIDKNIILGNSIIADKKIDPLAIDWKKTFHKVIESGGVDIFIGNPPYLTIKKEDFDFNSIYLNIVKGPVNTATLMVGRALEYLKKGGILAFVLPKTILHVNSYSKLREYIINNTSIIHIFDLGLKFKDVRGEQIILILKNEKPLPDHLIEIKILKNSEKNLKNQPSFFIKQSIFRSFNNKILILDNDLCYSILQKIQSKGKKLHNIVNGKIFRGLPLNNKISMSQVETTDEKIIKGKFIKKFKIDKIGFVSRKDVEIINTNLLNKIKTKKIVMQNIFSSESGIIAAYDEEGILSLDTVTNIIVQNDILAKYLLGLLHSKLINFYVSYGLYNGGRLTMHLDSSYIGEIPIANVKSIDQYNIIKLVENAIDGNQETKEVLIAIDKEVYKIYDLTKEEIMIIETEMNKLLSKKSKW